MMPGVQKPHWLAPVAVKAAAQVVSLVLGQAVERRDLTSADPAGRGHAADPRRAVHEHRATTALALGAAAVLGRPQAEAVPEDLEERRAVVGYLDLATVHGELDGHPDRPPGRSRWVTGRG